MRLAGSKHADQLVEGRLVVGIAGREADVVDCPEDARDPALLIEHRQNRLVRVQGRPEFALNLAGFDGRWREDDQHARTSVEGLVNRLIPVGARRYILLINPDVRASLLQFGGERQNETLVLPRIADEDADGSWHYRPVLPMVVPMPWW